MNTRIACGVVVFLTSGLLAQHRGVGTTAGTNAGYGNVVFPGGRPSITTPFTQTNTFANHLGNVVAGRPAFNGNGHRNFNSGNSNSGGLVYVPYPVYGGGYYGGYYSGYGDPTGMGVPQQQQPNINIIIPPAQPMPMMIGPAAQAQPPNASIREYGPQEQNTADANQPQQDSNYYLLAFKDHSIYSAVGYWVNGDTLHYITTGNVHNQVSLSLVDRDLTAQLNKGHGVQVNLPAGR